MSDTPRTDALLASTPECLGRYDYDRLAEHAKQLERELNLANAASGDRPNAERVENV